MLPIHLIDHHEIEIFLRTIKNTDMITLESKHYF